MKSNPQRLQLLLQYSKLLEDCGSLWLMSGHLAIVQCLVAEHGADVHGHGMVLNGGWCPGSHCTTGYDDGALFSCWQHPQGSRAMVKAAAIIRGDSIVGHR